MVDTKSDEYCKQDVAHTMDDELTFRPLDPDTVDDGAAAEYIHTPQNKDETSIIPGEDCGQVRCTVLNLTIPACIFLTRVLRIT